MQKKLTVSINAKLMDSILEGAKRLYPKETILLLRGKKNKEEIHVLNLVIPPFSIYGYGFASLPFHSLPVDFSVVGTVHSHPSGNIAASSMDLNHFFGRILMIVGFPFAGVENVAVYNSNGEKLLLNVTK